MHEQTPLDVLAELYPAFDAHDKLEAIGVLNSVETLILAGENDLMTPADHSREMAAALPAAELVVLPRAGHMLMLEHHRVVSDHIRRLVDRAMAARASA
jgi:pimeloyl-ACP methyl ester carboxylesterase